MAAILTSIVVAKRIGCLRDTLTRVARKKRIGRKVGRDWFFTAGEAKRLAKLVRPGPGAPAGKRR